MAGPYDAGCLSYGPRWVRWMQGTAVLPYLGRVVAWVGLAYIATALPFTWKSSAWIRSPLQFASPKSSATSRAGRALLRGPSESSPSGSPRSTCRTRLWAQRPHLCSYGLRSYGRLWAQRLHRHVCAQPALQTRCEGRLPFSAVQRQALFGCTWAVSQYSGECTGHMRGYGGPNCRSYLATLGPYLNTGASGWRGGRPIGSRSFDAVTDRTVQSTAHPHKRV